MHKNNYTLLKNNFNNQANKLHQLDFIYKEIANRMLSRLDYIKIEPNMILDLGSGLDIDSKLLQNKFQKSKLIRLDLAINMLKLHNTRNSLFSKIFHKNQSYVCANAIDLPLASQQFDLIWSNLLMPYIDNLEQLLKEMHRVLRINGALLMSGLAVDSLKQLRDLGLSTYNFPDMHIIGDLLVKFEFTNPVIDVEYITLEYDNLEQLLKDIRIIGCGGNNINKAKLTRHEYLSIQQKFAQITQNQTIPLTLEIFYAHAWKTKPRLDLGEGKKIIEFTPHKK